MAVMGLISRIRGRKTVLTNQADTPLPVSVPYELQRGGIYMFEVKDWSGPKKQWADLNMYYREVHDIDVIFVTTGGNHVGIYPVPPAETKKMLPQRLPQAKAKKRVQKNATRKERQNHGE